MAWTTQHEGKIHTTKSHEECSEQLGMCTLNDCGPLALKMLLVVNSFEIVFKCILKCSILCIFSWDVGSVQEGGLTDVGIEVLHRLLSHVIHGPREQVGVGDDQVTAFLETLKKGLLDQLLTLLTLMSKFKFSFVVPTILCLFEVVGRSCWSINQSHLV